MWQLALELVCLRWQRHSPGRGGWKWPSRCCCRSDAAWGGEAAVGARGATSTAFFLPLRGPGTSSQLAGVVFRGCCFGSWLLNFCVFAEALACLVLSNTRRGWANVPRWGERQPAAAGSLLSSHYPNYTWACVLCRPSPEFPFRFIWVLGWSTWHLALDPSSVLYLQHKLCSYLDALQHLPPPQPAGANMSDRKRRACITGGAGVL
jgi:hypothetical protein